MVMGLSCGRNVNEFFWVIMKMMKCWLWFMLLILKMIGLI